MKDINTFTKKTLDRFAKEMTDQVFVFIQKDRELMHDYLMLLSKHNLKNLNSTIAKAVKKRFVLTNKINKGTPKSTLIQSYEEFI
jgi:hypothetical protein